MIYKFLLLTLTLIVLVTLISHIQTKSVSKEKLNTLINHRSGHVREEDTFSLVENGESGVKRGDATHLRLAASKVRSANHKKNNQGAPFIGLGGKVYTLKANKPA